MKRWSRACNSLGSLEMVPGCVIRVSPGSQSRYTGTVIHVVDSETLTLQQCRGRSRGRLSLEHVIARVIVGTAEKLFYRGNLQYIIAAAGCRRVQAP